MITIKKIVTKSFKDHIELIDKVMKTQENNIICVVNCIINALKNGNKIIFMGNGGSASDSQHLAAELVGRFKIDRNALPSIALTTDTSIITAIGNDFGFDAIFSRQIEAIANEGDVVIGISTSGNSKNIIKGVESALNKNCKVIGFAGKNGGELKKMIQEDMILIIPSNDTARIQESHILLGHIICEVIDLKFKG